MTLDATGLTIKTLAEIRAEVVAQLEADVGPQIQTGPETVLGQMIDVFSAQLANSQELNQQQYDAFDPDTASGAQLDAICAYAAVTREPATNSTGTLTITGTPTTFIPTGSVYRVPDGARFVTTADATIPGGGSIDVAIESEDTGEISAAAGAITEPVTIIAGVSSVTNAEAVTEGQEIETDAQLRQRREASLQLIGSGTDGAIKAKLAALPDVDDAIVISNRTLVTDAFGIPAKAFRAVIWPAQTDNDPVFTAIWESAPAGIASDGAVTGTITDSQGISQDVAFSVATELATEVEVIVTTDPLTYGGDADVLAAVLSVTDLLLIGDDLRLFAISSAVVQQVTGLTSIEVRAAVGVAPGPADIVDIIADLDEIITVDSADIVVTSS